MTPPAPVSHADASTPARHPTAGAVYCALLAVCGAYTAAVLGLAPVVRVTLDSGHEVIVLRSALFESLRWVWVALGALLPILTLSAPRPRAAVVWALRPLAVLPLAGILALVSDCLPPVWTACMVFVIAAAVAGVVGGLLSLWLDRRDESAAPREWTLRILIISTLAYGGLGLYLAHSVGEHLGDEGHYLTQARSLFEDGDLDLRNDIMKKPGRRPPAGYERHYTHISQFSRGDHWYSYHPYGLPLLLAPLWGIGLAVRYLVLGFFGGLANAGAYALARATGAGRRAALVAVGALGVSFPWAVYAGRALPETLGAALLAWLFWCIVRQAQRPWATAAIAAACCTALVMTQERFIPLSLLGFGFYGLFGLFSPESRPARVRRLAAFTLLTMAGYGLYVASQFALYRGGLKVPPGNVFMAYPLGMWGIVAGERGLVSLMPSVLWCCAAMVLWPLRRRECRPMAAAVLTTIAAALVLTCSNTFYIGGSCVPGRYLIVLLPLTVPATAALLERTHPSARWWLLFLTAVSMAWLVLTVVFMDEVGRGFILPVHNLRKAHPYLAGLILPHASYRYACPPLARLGTTLMVAGVGALTLLVLAARRRAAPFVTAAAALGTLALTAFAQFAQETRLGEEHSGAAALARRLHPSGGAQPVIRIRGLRPGESALDILRVPFTGTARGGETIGVTTRDLGAHRAGMLISQPRTDVNDWAGRGYRWATLNEPRPPQAGWQVLHLDGTLDGAATLHVAIREGSGTLIERPLPARDGKISADFLISCNGRRGFLYLLVRLEGEGAFRSGDLYWAPWSEELPRSTGARLPDGIIRGD